MVDDSDLLELVGHIEVHRLVDKLAGRKVVAGRRLEPVGHIVVHKLVDKLAGKMAAEAGKRPVTHI